MPDYDVHFLNPEAVAGQLAGSVNRVYDRGPDTAAEVALRDLSYTVAEQMLEGHGRNLDGSEAPVEALKAATFRLGALAMADALASGKAQLHAADAVQGGGGLN